MPLYQFQCPACSTADSVFRAVDDRSEIHRCPSCWAPMVRDYQTEAAGPHLDREFATPIQMHSIALVHADDIEAFQHRNPEAEISTDPRHELYGVPIARTRSQKLAILEKEGFVEKN